MVAGQRLQRSQACRHRTAAVAQARPVCADDRTRPPLAHREALSQMSHRLMASILA